MPLHRFRYTTRRVPGTRWFSVFGSPTAEPGNSWQYGGAYRRVCLHSDRLGYGVGVLVMPRSGEPSRFRGRRRIAYLRGLVEGRYTP